MWWTPAEKTATSPAAPVTSYTSALPPCTSGGAVRVVCAGPSGVTQVEVAPVATTSTLWVAAYDKAGNVSYNVATSSAAAGVQVTRAALPDLGQGHVWNADAGGATVLTDRVGSVPVTIGSNAGWGASGLEDPQLRLIGLTSLNRFLKAGVTHATGTSGSIAGYALESTVGQLARYGTGLPQPAGSQLLYICAYGAGNMLSPSATCEGTGVTGRPLGYGWTSAAAVPAGYASMQVYRCRIGVDYYMSKQSGCEVAGAVRDGMQLFLIQYAPTTTPAGIVDTTRSFTVSARVKPANPGSYQTVVSASPAAGSKYSAFYLQTYEKTWQFCMHAQGPTTPSRAPSVPPWTPAAT